MFKIFVDENIPKITILELKSKGFEVIDIRGTELEGISDEELWLLVQKNKCLLITTDRGFSQKRFEEHYCVLIVNLKLPNQLKINAKIIDTLKNTESNFWYNQIAIVKDNTVIYTNNKNII